MTDSGSFSLIADDLIEFVVAKNLREFLVEQLDLGELTDEELCIELTERMQDLGGTLVEWLLLRVFGEVIPYRPFVHFLTCERRLALSPPDEDSQRSYIEVWLETRGFQIPRSRANPQRLFQILAHEQEPMAALTAEKPQGSVHSASRHFLQLIRFLTWYYLWLFPDPEVRRSLVTEAIDQPSSGVDRIDELLVRCSLTQLAEILFQIRDFYLNPYCSRRPKTQKFSMMDSRQRAIVQKIDAVLSLSSAQDTDVLSRQRLFYSRLQELFDIWREDEVAGGSTPNMIPRGAYIDELVVKAQTGRSAWAIPDDGPLARLVGLHRDSTIQGGDSVLLPGLYQGRYLCERIEPLPEGTDWETHDRLSSTVKEPTKTEAVRRHRHRLVVLLGINPNVFREAERHVQRDSSTSLRSQLIPFDQVAFFLLCKALAKDTSKGDQIRQLSQISSESEQIKLAITKIKRIVVRKQGIQASLWLGDDQGRSLLNRATIDANLVKVPLLKRYAGSLTDDSWSEVCERRTALLPSGESETFGWESEVDGKRGDDREYSAIHRRTTRSRSGLADEISRLRKHFRTHASVTSLDVNRLIPYASAGVYRLNFEIDAFFYSLGHEPDDRRLWNALS